MFAFLACKVPVRLAAKLGYPTKQIHLRFRRSEICCRGDGVGLLNTDTEVSAICRMVRKDLNVASTVFNRKDLLCHV